MPIDQRTIISVIVAGRNFKASYEDILNRLRFMDITLKTDDLHLFKSQWEKLITHITLPFSTAVRDAVLLETQYNHYRINGPGNERRAAKALYKRRKAGIQPRTKSQRTINTVQTPPSVLTPPLTLSTAPATFENDISDIDIGPDPETDPDGYLEWYNQKHPPRQP